MTDISGLEFHFIGGVHENDDGTFRFDISFTGFKTKGGAAAIGRFAHKVINDALADIPSVEHVVRSEAKN